MLFYTRCPSINPSLKKKKIECKAAGSVLDNRDSSAQGVAKTVESLVSLS